MQVSRITKPDIQPLREICSEYGSVSSEIQTKYKCMWDDSVHDSYGKYVQNMKSASEELRKILSEAESLSRDLDGVESLLSEGESLIREAT